MESNNNSVPSEAPTPETSPLSVQPTTPPEPVPGSESKPAKSPKPIIWCLAILAIIGIVAAAVFAYLYFTTPTTPTPTPDNDQSSTAPSDNTQPTSTPSVAEVTKLLENKYNFKEKELKLCFGLGEIFCGMDNFDKEAKLQFAIHHTPETLFSEKEYVDNQALYKQEIKYDDLNKVYQDYFGSSDSIDKADYEFKPTFLKKMEYIADSDSFIIQFADGLGGATSIALFNKVVETQKTEEGFVATIISVTVDQEARSTEEPFLGYFGEQQLYEMGIPIEDIEAIQESLSAYHFNFVKERDDYKLVSIEKL